MTTTTHGNSTAPINKFDELILVIKRDYIINNTLHGSFTRCTDFSPYEKEIIKHQEFIPRGRAENDFSYKQIIPYLIFHHNNTYFLMQRRSTASEQRLKNKLSLGIGGHLRQEDMQTSSLLDWSLREFEEEIHYNGSFTAQPFGIINDESNDVGKVHIGFAFILNGDSTNISIKSELKSGTLISLDECLNNYESLETWSQFIVTELAKNRI